MKSSTKLVLAAVFLGLLKSAENYKYIKIYLTECPIVFYYIIFKTLISYIIIIFSVRYVFKICFSEHKI